MRSATGRGGDGVAGFGKDLAGGYPETPAISLAEFTVGQRLEQAPGLPRSQGAAARHWMPKPGRMAERPSTSPEAWAEDRRARPAGQGRDVELTFYDSPPALEACTHDQPHREHVRHGSPAHLPDQGLPVAQDGDGHGLQTMPVRSEKMEKTRWIEPSRRDHSRRQIRRWRTPGSRRRMISPYTTFDNSSAIYDPPHRQRSWRQPPTAALSSWQRCEYSSASGGRALPIARPA